jgi:hypothetical protein
MSKEKKKFEGVSGVTGVGRASYPFLFTPQKSELSDKENYSITLIFDPEVPEEMKAVEDLKEIADSLGKERFGDDWGEDTEIRNPVKYGNPKLSKTKPEVKGKYSITFKCDAAKSVPGVVDAKGGLPIAANQTKGMYAGCYCRVSFYAMSYAVDGGRGVTFKLNNVLKVRDGEPIGSTKTTASEDFENFYTEAPEPAADSTMFS